MNVLKMAEVDCETVNNVTIEIKSKCYDSTPKDRYHVVYSYPYDDYGSAVENAIGDSLFISSGNSSFLTQNISEDVNKTTITFSAGDTIYGELPSGGELSVGVIPFGGVDTSVTMTDNLNGTFSGSTVQVGITYAFTFVTVTSLLTCIVSDITSVYNNITINLITHIITVN